MSDYEIYDIPQFKTQSGFTLNVKLAYKTFGRLSASGDNAVVIQNF